MGNIKTTLEKLSAGFNIIAKLDPNGKLIAGANVIEITSKKFKTTRHADNELFHLNWNYNNNNNSYFFDLRY